MQFSFWENKWNDVDIYKKFHTIYISYPWILIRVLGWSQKGSFHIYILWTNRVRNGEMRGLETHRQVEWMSACKFYLNACWKLDSVLSANVKTLALLFLPHSNLACWVWQYSHHLTDDKMPYHRVNIISSRSSRHPVEHPWVAFTSPFPFHNGWNFCLGVDMVSGKLNSFLAP